MGKRKNSWRFEGDGTAGEHPLWRGLMDRTFDGFDPRIEPCPTTGCWLWLGHVGPYGHGQVIYRGVRTTAHRAFYQQRHGMLPSGVHLDHIVCKTPSCVNPDHLRPVTPRQNALENSDSIAARNALKAACPRCGGHFTVGADGKRFCRPCRNAHGREYARAKYRARALLARVEGESHV